MGWLFQRENAFTPELQELMRDKMTIQIKALSLAMAIKMTDAAKAKAWLILFPNVLLI